jgi:phosphorylcholine metabolism protein LicD
MTTEKKLLTLKEAAQAKNVTTRTIRLWIDQFRIDYCLDTRNKTAVIDNERFRNCNRITAPKHETKNTVESEIYLQQLEKENSALREKLSKYEADALTKDDLQGFSLHQRKTSGKALFWYAGKMIGGKQVWIYVGKDVSRAKEKINSWLQNRGL